MILDYLNAFWVGGLLCLIGQIFIDYTKATPARILTTYVVAGVALGGLGLWEPVTTFAGSGATVPLVGFGYLLAKGTREAIAEKGIIGILSGGLSAAAAGIAAAVFFGLLASLAFKSREK